MRIIYFQNAFIVALFFAIFLLNGYSQDIEARIKIAENSIFIQGRIVSNDIGIRSKNWSFLENYADSESLVDRVSNLSLYDELGQSIEIKQFTPGEFETQKPATSFSYVITAKLSEKLSSAAHISWLSKNHGILMLNDLFPQWQKFDKTPIKSKIILTLPTGWQVISSETRESAATFITNDFSKAIFLIGNNLREKRAWIGKHELSFATVGEWKFSDELAIQSASEILQEYKRLFGEFADKKSQILLLPFSNDNISDNWRAETRGNTATIISGNLPFKTLAEQRLYEQFRHELLHFWLPNGLALSGNYDWFFEGFSIYYALRTGIELNQIRFEDFLTTISQTYRSANNLDNGQMSLLEASKNRWLAPTPIVYNKGLIVAFMVDISILNESKGKKSLADIFRQIWKKHKFPNVNINGNEAIFKAFAEHKEVDNIFAKYVSGKQKIEFTNQLEFFGLEYLKSENKIVVLDKLSGKQKDLLDKLGYNQWRKLTEKQK
jgi:predicted metalloprotease with PDZ domain